MARYKSPTGSPIVATAEVVLASASIAGINDDGTPEYDSTGSTMHWDTQESRLRDGKILYEDDDGAEWTFDQLIKIEEEADA